KTNRGLESGSRVEQVNSRAYQGRPCRRFSPTRFPSIALARLNSRTPTKKSGAPKRAGIETPTQPRPQSGGRLHRAIAGIALEEQRLACHCRHHGGLERLRDQERRLRTLAGQEALRIGGDEHHRHLEAAQKLVDRIEP